MDSSCFDSPRFTKNLFTTLAAALILSLSIGCGKKDDDDDDDPAIAAEKLMVNIDVNCGDDPCIPSGSSLAVTAEETFVQTIRGFYWLIMGFPEEDGYNDFVDESKQDTIPQDGLVGRIVGAREHVVETILANFSGISECADAPTSGSVEEDDGTITFAKAENSAPASFPKTGKYDKRAEYVTDDMTAGFEWFCDYSGMMTKFEIAVDDETFHYVFYYDRDDEDDSHFEFYLFDDTGTINSTPISLALKVHELEDSFRLWVTRTGLNDDDKFVAYRTAGHTNIDSQETSLMYQDLSNSPLTTAQWEASSAVSDETVTGGVAMDSGSSGSKRQGCAENFDQATYDISSSTLCDDLDLEEPEAPGLDEDGNWSMEWIQANLEDILTDMN